MQIFIQNVLKNLKKSAENHDCSRKNRLIEGKMGPTDYIPTEDAALAQWLELFSSTCAARAAELGLTPEEVDEIAAISLEFRDSLAATTATYALYKGALARKNEDRQNATSLARKFARRFKSNDTIPESTLAEMEIVKSYRSGPVVPVTNLLVIPDGKSTIQLKWNRNQNAPTTTFLIEYRYDGSEDWRFAGSTTKTKFVHDNRVPGETLFYRVRATRAGQTSANCPAVCAYPTFSASSRAAA